MNAYSHDLRQKIVEAMFERGMGKSEAARAFGVSLSSVKRYVRAASEGRSLAPKKRPGSKPKLSEQAKSHLAPEVEDRRLVTPSQRREYLKAVAAVSVSNSTVCRELKRVAHTREKGA